MRGELRTARWIFFRALALIHLFAFASFLVQARALIGSRGILPLAPFLELVERRIGEDRFLEFPNLFWVLGGSDAAILACAWLGIAFAMLLLFGILEHAALLSLWALYLSVSIAGRTFYSFQWDILLLEVTIASLFLAAPRIVPWIVTNRVADPPDRSAFGLLWLVLFKLVFMSGVAKWRSGDESWRSLDALLYHYETQPLPTWIGWWVHQLPPGFQRFSVGAMFFIQLVVPFLIFGPRIVRLGAAALLAFLQVLIALTGNYCFFNLLALAMCVLLIDDAIMKRILPGWFRAQVLPPIECPPSKTGRLGFGIRAVLLVPFFVLNGLLIVRAVCGFEEISEAGERLLERVSPFRTVSSYGLFAVMTTSRKEIIVEGSDDGLTWKAYEFLYKPGDLNRRPGFVAPHQPRLDWQMWFAALGTARQNPWFRAFISRLGQGSPEVIDLLEANPFPDHPPRWFRAELYEYHFTDLSEHERSGGWWKRTHEGTWFGPVDTARALP